MKKVPYDIIDTAAEQVSDELNTNETLVVDMARKHPVIFNYVMGEQFELIGEDVQELMLYATIVIANCMSQIAPLPKVSIDTLDKLQANNWDTIENLPPLKKQTFEEYVEPIIGPHSQDELLYFIIDVFDQDDESDLTISKESKIPIFVGLKSVVDAWNV